MKPTAFLHEGVRNFAMACRYARTDGDRFGITDRRYDYYLGLASKLLANYHVVEAAYYYHWINEVKTLDSHHKSLWELAKRINTYKVEPNEFYELCESGEESLLPSCGIYALLKNNQEVAEKVFNKISTANPTFLGKEVFLAYRELNNNKDDDCQFIRFKDYISQLDPGNDVLSKLNYARAYTLIINLEEIEKKLSVSIQTLYKRLKKKIEEDNFKWAENIFLQLPPDNQVSEYISKCARTIEEGINIFQPNKLDDEPIQIKDEPWLKYFLKISKKQEFEWTPAKKMFATYKLPDLDQDSEYYKEIQACKSSLENYLGNIQKIDQGFKYYLNGLKEKLSYTCLKSEVISLERICILLQEEEFQQEIQKFEILSQKKIFISYSSKDRKQMLELKKELESLEIEVSVDDKGIQLQDEIVKKTDEMVRKNDFTISLVSPNSLMSPWVGQESIAAFKKEWFHDEPSTFIPIVISEEIRNFDLRPTIRKEIQKRLKKIKNEQEERDKINASTKDLEGKKELLKELMSKLGEIFYRIDNTLTIDYSNKQSYAGSINKLIDLLVKMSNKTNSINSQESAP